MPGPTYFSMPAKVGTAASFRGDRRPSGRVFSGAVSADMKWDPRIGDAIPTIAYSPINAVDERSVEKQGKLKDPVEPA